jgi:LL-diaminopimelate aminotransferase
MPAAVSFFEGTSMATTPFVKSDRLQKLPPYLFAEIDKKKKAAIAAGRDVINLGVGDPDRPTPPAIIRSLQHHVENPAFHQYALDQGAPELRQSIADFCKRRYALDLDPGSEILPLIGSKEGIAHFPLAVLNPGEISLVPDPCYPVYRSSSMFAGADVYTMPLEPSLQFRPDLESIPSDVYARARLMFLNYPNNPTGGTADIPFFERVVDKARTHNLVIAQDAAYNEMYYEHPAPSLLQVAGAKERTVEFHSLSKTFNMTGWRVGFAIGGAPLIAALGQVKANTDSGIFTAIQFAGKTALDEYETLTTPIRALYKERRDAFIGALKQIGWDVRSPEATFYVWIPCPKGYSSTELCARLLDEADVVTTPGLGFGRTADGYIRAALTVETPRLLEAVARIGRLKL